MRRAVLVPCLATFALVVAAGAGRPAEPNAAAAGGIDSARIDALLATTMAAGRLPSLSVAIARGGEVVYAHALGLADLESSVPATVRTVYAVGSVTKPLTAVATLQLAERGALDLEAPIERYCPAFPVKAPGVTLRRLLAHLGGVRGYDFRRFEEDFLNRKSYDSIEAAMVKFRDDPLAAPPGSKYVYSGWGYVLVGCAVEKASGGSYGDYLRRHVLEPAGMAQARLDVPGVLVPFRARGYAREDDGSWSAATCFNPSDRYPAGGLLATPTDLVRFGSAVLAGKLVNQSSQVAMWTPQVTSGGQQTRYGLGWNLSVDGAEVFHGGTSVGATAHLYLRPREGLAIAFATNLELWNEGRHELAQQLAALVAAP